jgi:hypothetical protein
MNETANETPPERTKAKRTNGTVYLTVRTLSFVRTDDGLTTDRRRPANATFSKFAKNFLAIQFHNTWGPFNHIEVKGREQKYFWGEDLLCESRLKQRQPAPGASAGSRDRSGPPANRIGAKGPCYFR